MNNQFEITYARDISWEPLPLRFHVRQLNIIPDTVSDTVQAAAVSWDTRTRRTSCACRLQFASAEWHAEDHTCQVRFEWACMECLEGLLETIARALGDVDRVMVGEDEVLIDEGRTTEWVAVPEKRVELEDGRAMNVAAFSIARVEVTIEQFKQFVDATGYQTTAELTHAGVSYLDHPRLSVGTDGLVPGQIVACVSYSDALAYCDWMHVSLPTEWEWLSAAIVDEHVYKQDEWQRLWEPSGKLTASQQPNSLVFGAGELTGRLERREGQRDGVVVRFGPRFVLREGWQHEVDRHRMILDPLDFDDGIGFRCVQRCG